VPQDDALIIAILNSYDKKNIKYLPLTNLADWLPGMGQGHACFFMADGAGPGIQYHSSF